MPTELLNAYFDRILPVAEGGGKTLLAGLFPLALLIRVIQMLLMGAYAHSPLRALLVGSKTTDLLRAATIPTLLLR